MQIKFDVFWTKSLGTLYKDNSVDTYGKEAKVNLGLEEVLNIYANFKVGENSFTDSIEILDIDNDGVMEIILELPRYEGAPKISLVKYIVYSKI